MYVLFFKKTKRKILIFSSIVFKILIFYFLRYFEIDNRIFNEILREGWKQATV